MKKTILILFALLPVNLMAQQTSNTDLYRKVRVQSQKIEKQRKQLNTQEKAIKILKTDKQQLEIKQNQLGEHITQQNSQIRELNQNQTRLSQQFGLIKLDNQNSLNTINQNIEKKANNDDLVILEQKHSDLKYFLIAGTLSLLILFSLSYYWLSRRIKQNQIGINKLCDNYISTNGKDIIANKLASLLEKYTEIDEPIQTVDKIEELDHSLALKVADEIVRIHKNISNMDTNTKGLKQLKASIRRIQDNFLANGYELVDMLGKEYHEGMNLIANFVTSDEVETGKQVITRIIKPQVNYNGKMIQAAQIEVTIGE